MPTPVGIAQRAQGFAVRRLVRLQPDALPLQRRGAVAGHYSGDGFFVHFLFSEKSWPEVRPDRSGGTAFLHGSADGFQHTDDPYSERAVIHFGSSVADPLQEE